MLGPDLSIMHYGSIEGGGCVCVMCECMREQESARARERERDRKIKKSNRRHTYATREKVINGEEERH